MAPGGGHHEENASRCGPRSDGANVVKGPLNPSMDPVTVYRGMRVATLQSVDVPTTREVGVVNEGGTPEVAQEKREMLWDLVDNSAAELSPGEKPMLM